MSPSRDRESSEMQEMGWLVVEEFPAPLTTHMLPPISQMLPSAGRSV